MRIIDYPNPPTDLKATPTPVARLRPDMLEAASTPKGAPLGWTEVSLRPEARLILMRYPVLREMAAATDAPATRWFARNADQGGLQAIAIAYAHPITLDPTALLAVFANGADGALLRELCENMTIVVMPSHFPFDQSRLALGDLAQGCGSTLLAVSTKGKVFHEIELHLGAAQPEDQIAGMAVGLGEQDT